jgi:8-oxo-dGTP diphosphatase
MVQNNKRRYSYDYPRPSVTVDIVVLSHNVDPDVLLIRRKHEPFAGCWALPGGFVDMEETLEAAAQRELCEETGVEAKELIQVHTFGDPGRDPRGRTISVVYLTILDQSKIKPRPADDAAGVGWHSLRHLPGLAFDHAQILGHVRTHLDSLKRTEEINGKLV